MTDKPFKIEFHPSACERFDEMAQIVLNDIQSFPPVEPSRAEFPQSQPVITIPADDIIGEVTVEQSLVNLLGERSGYFWESKGRRFGWQGPQYEGIRQLTQRIEKASEGRVSYDFLHQHIVQWLREKLEFKRNDSFSGYMGDQCSMAIKDHEIWIPVYRTYSVQDFTIGEVEFRTMTKSILDPWYSKLTPNGKTEPNSLDVINRERANLQGSIVACVKVTAEREKAVEIAHARVDQAVGLLRFISPVNITCRLTSHCVPVGKENTQQTTEFFFEEGEIRGSNRAWVDHGPIDWSVDDARGAMPGLLELLQKLAADPDGTEFRKLLYHALQLHSRHSIAIEIPNKLVFVIASIESLLLKDSNEPIQKNLAERMAFIIGQDLPQRKEIVNNVEAFYRVRSGLFHHGENVQSGDLEVIDKFFRNVWTCFSSLLNSIDSIKTKNALIARLEDRKLN
jgi:Apea-like HEPN